MRELWRRIEQVLQRHAPETAATLAPAASEQDLAALEATIGIALPNDFRESLKVHDGQDDPTRCRPFTGDGLLLSTAEIADRWKMLTEIEEGERTRGGPGYGPWWKTTCIPFTDADGNALCIDMDPGLNDRTGEVVCHVHDGEIERGIATSYRAWLSSLADRLEAGRFEIDEWGDLWPDREVSPN
jgi:cell wall assembly regulator SMI1